MSEAHDWVREGRVIALREQLERGFSRLVFASALEREFLADYAAEAAIYRRVLVGSSLVAVVVIMLVDNLVIGLPAALAPAFLTLQLGVLIPALALALVVCSRRTQNACSEIALMGAAAIVSLVTLHMRALGAQVGFDVPLEYTAAAAAGVCVLGRVRMRWLAPLLLMLALALVVNALWRVAPAIEGWYRVGANLMLVGISAAGAYGFEYVFRKSWLDRRQLELLSDQDPLTGLLNRRAFYVDADRGLRQALRERCTIGVALLDIDGFKGYNDTYGHAAGDVCLRRVAERIAHAAGRPLDCCARFGGEEFVIVWFDADVAQKTEDLLEDIRGLQIRHEQPAAWPIVTASLGAVVATPGPRTSIEELLDHADRAMYQAKRAGGNHCRIEQLSVRAGNALVAAHIG